MVDNTDHEVKYIKTNRLNLEGTLPSRVKQEDEDREPLAIDLFQSCEDKICADEMDNMVEKEEEERNEDLQGIPANWTVPIHYSCWVLTMHHQVIPPAGLSNERTKILTFQMRKN